MKNTIISAFAALGLTAGVATADDFDNTQMFTTIETGAFEFTLNGNYSDGLAGIGVEESGFAGLGIRADVYGYNLGTSVNGTVALTFDYVEGVDAVAFGVENTFVYDVGSLDLYATPNVIYVASTDDFGSGDFFTNPSLGASYEFSDTVTAFGEVSYTWNMSESFERFGGKFEVGADFALTETMTLRPSLVRTFDTAEDETQARIGVIFSF